MKTSALCPVCEGRLSLWAGLRAPTPFRLRCPHCRTLLLIRIRGLWLVFTFMVLFACGAVASCVALFLQFGWRAAIVGVSICVHLPFIADIATRIVFFTYADFVPEQRGGDA